MLGVCAKLRFQCTCHVSIHLLHADALGGRSLATDVLQQKLPSWCLCRGNSKNQGHICWKEVSDGGAAESYECMFFHPTDFPLIFLGHTILFVCLFFWFPVMVCGKVTSPSAITVVSCFIFLVSHRLCCYSLLWTASGHWSLLLTSEPDLSWNTLRHLQLYIKLALFVNCSLPVEWFLFPCFWNGLKRGPGIWVWLFRCQSILNCTDYNFLVHDDNIQFVSASCNQFACLFLTSMWVAKLFACLTGILS